MEHLISFSLYVLGIVLLVLKYNKIIADYELKVKAASQTNANQYKTLLEEIESKNVFINNVVKSKFVLEDELERCRIIILNLRKAERKNRNLIKKLKSCKSNLS